MPNNQYSMYRVGYKGRTPNLNSHRMAHTSKIPKFHEQMSPFLYATAACPYHYKKMQCKSTQQIKWLWTLAEHFSPLQPCCNRSKKIAGDMYRACKNLSSTSFLCCSDVNGVNLEQIVPYPLNMSKKSGPWIISLNWIDLLRNWRKATQSLEMRSLNYKNLHYHGTFQVD